VLWFGITTFMFVLGTTALVLQKALELQNINFVVFYYADGVVTRLMYIRVFQSTINSVHYWTH
ncbi:hypothetical protein EDB86DRAFT_2933273, partial [Lactarius hatsudake]